VVKKGGAIVHREAETFDRKQASQRLDRQAGGWARRQGHSQAWYPYVWAWGWACRSAGRSLKRMAGARGPVRTCPGAPPSNLLCLPDRTLHRDWIPSGPRLVWSDGHHCSQSIAGLGPGREAAQHRHEKQEPQPNSA